MASSSSSAGAEEGKEPSNNSNGSGLWSWLQNFADDQSLGRLKQCQQLADSLEACQQHQATAPALDEFGLGKRWMVYFGWRDLPIANKKGCVPEQHALWGCRALSVRCGGELQQMKKCFDEQGMEAILAQRKTAYASAKNQQVQDKIPCYELQRVVGKCVARTAKEMEQRKNSR
ncbi:expressed unknown protein [Seminavis robusta]|uniref:Uncharacterized protein n=1 Tax=Seminavis robusta TaxID=568900 RepID=A0A9N8DC20_9STRA|nr:expressed unknown protein [Seminavis robusta]|eukprot:Sro54_g031750.1 n/a (174) ;mRNA; r:32934-33455